MPNRFGLYVHIPFCVHKCSYCDFFSFTRYTPADFSAATARIRREIEEAAAWLGPRPTLSSIFLGGGTPSLLPIPELAAIFESIARVFRWDAETEITTEANPETVHEDFLRGLAAHTPINRVSLGAQSFDPRALKALERLGSAESIETASRLLAKNGFENFSLDLIFGIPGQGREGLIDDIERAAALGPRHLSFYNLTLKPAHPLYGQLPNDDDAADLYETGVERLASLGYQRYEISNFAHPGFESRHNLLYWDGGDYLGVGPSAASRFFVDGRFHHRKGWSDYEKYLGSGAFPEPAFEASDASQTILEATFLELRKREGVHLPSFAGRYGYELSEARNFALFSREGLLHREGDTLKLTERGFLLADRVTRDLVD